MHWCRKVLDCEFTDLMYYQGAKCQYYAWILVGGGGYLTKFVTGRLRPEVQPLTLFYTILAEKVPLFYTFY